MQARYTEVLYNLMNNAHAMAAINTAMSDYPLYANDESKEIGGVKLIPTREELNKKILDYYKYREIGFETFGRFLDELRTSLNEIMPKYNQLFYSLDQEFNVVYNVDYEKKIIRSLDGTNGNTQSTSTTTSTSVTDGSNVISNTTSNDKNVKSLTPQNELNISNTEIDTVSYADEASWNKNSATSSSSTSGTSSTSGSGSNNVIGSVTTDEDETTTETTKGNYGVVSAQDLILKYRETIINVEQLIINDPRIAELFMMVY